ncbi:hypothetical protein TrRE_jg8089 [Triparma retinervis]|uniref:CW-type domain-containing protein n=1 Tax=Triparma retinervis TaxID=2557542 RepID=A0A9W6ZT08_9STRA|nr:hypothetical protein TrRE_jg8089 [Triparma retinervis]
MVTELVKRKYLNEIDGRDTARCLAVNVDKSTDVEDLCARLGEKYGGRVKEKWCLDDPNPYTQIILDYFWIPPGWAEQHWTEKFFTANLTNFASILAPNGCVYLPFQEHTFNMCVKNINKLRKNYSVTFLKKWELDEIALWRYTQDIDEDVMQNVYRKKLEQEEEYCILYNFNKIADDSYTQAALSWLDDIPNTRYIKLRLLSPEDHKIAKMHRSKHPLPMVDPKSSEPIHYAGFVHMVGKKKNVVREFGKVDDSTQKLRSVLNMPPPTFEMLNEEGMTVATKRYRFLAWRCAAADDRRLKYFANKALKSPTAKLVPAPSWCMKWCEIQGISRGPATVVSDPVAWEDLAHEMTRQFSPAYLLSEAYRLSIAMKAVFNDAIRGLVHFGLEQYPVVSRKDWDYNFPELCTTPLWVIHYVIDYHLNSQGDPVHTYDELMAAKRKQIEEREAIKRQEQEKAMKREQARLRREEERLIRNEAKRKKKATEAMELEGAMSARETQEDDNLLVIVETTLVLKTVRDMINKVITRIDGPDSSEIEVDNDKTIRAKVESVNWVQCDKCDAWHILPKEKDPNVIPETWTCEMATWTLQQQESDKPPASNKPTPNKLPPPLPVHSTSSTASSSSPSAISPLFTTSASSVEESSPILLQSASSASSGESSPIILPAAKKQKLEPRALKDDKNDLTPMLTTTTTATTTISPHSVDNTSNGDGNGDGDGNGNGNGDGNGDGSSSSFPPTS